ncbi:hypothetical protein QYE76_059696, partial [Lolium multiflorum]
GLQTAIARISQRAVTPGAKIKRRPIHATGPMMTDDMASSINFNQFLEKEKLKSNGSNFTDWFRHVRIFLNGGNLQYVLDAPLGDPPAETETDEVKNVYVTRKTRYSQVQCAILCSLESDLQKRFEHHDPHELIKELKTIFETHAAVECYEASKHFFSCMMEEGSSISEHMLVMTGHAKKLSDLGIVIPNRLGINRVLQSLPPSYKNFVMNYNMQNMNKEFPELFGMLKAAEIEIKKEHQVLMVNKTTSFKKQGKSKGKNKKSGKKAATPPVKPKSGPKPDAECYYCKEKGHWKRNCSKYLADLKSGLELKNKRQLLKDEVTMRVGNGSKVNVIAVGTLPLHLPSGLVLSLNNCYYVPALSMNIISGSCLMQDGYSFKSENNGCSIFMNNIFYGRAPQKNGLFLLDLDSSNTHIHNIDAKRIKLNDNSTYMWHCRLGHIGVKRMKKLHTDGLLESLDFESLDRCEACLMGKMTKTPFSGMMERATDLLEIIHTDVCGPMSVASRGGYRYVLTFTDDLSRYGYIYLMKHKSETFEKFKEFQSEVENQQTAAFTLNRAPSKSVETTPYELWFNKKPKLSFLKVWGCEAYVKKLQPDKLEPKAEKCVFIGYPKETIGYTFYHRSEGKIFVAKNGTFLEKEFLTKEVTGRKVELDEIEESLLVDQSSAVPENVPVPPTPATEEANDNDHETSNETATEPRRSTRDRATPDWYDPCLNVMIVDNNDEDPATYEEAMMSPDSNKWQEAMKSEMGSMYDNKVWTLVDLPDSRKAVENKWIFKRKTDADGIQTPKPGKSEDMASSINFNQFLEKEKLKSNGSNFTDWFRHVRIFLNGGNLQYVLDAPLGDPPAETETDEVKNVYVTRKTRYSQVQCAILCSLESDLQKRFEHHDPHELIKELKTIFETHAAVECYEASKHFFSCMMEEGSSISEHMLVMTGHAKKLSDLGIVIPNRLGINRVLQSLPPSYKNFVMNYNMQNMNKEFPELFGMLKAAEIEIKKEHQVLMVNKTTSFKKQGKSKGKNKKSGKKAATPPVKPKSGPKPDAECYYCKEKGHWKRNCSKYLADLKSGLVKKKKEDGYSFKSENNGCSIFMNNIFYGRAPQKNVKRMKKLHTDGLLESLDFESLDRCEACLMGKMTKTPFSGMMERATDLLEIIHTDVCGPMSVASRGGYRYVLTFTDDLSRYGYIYLMKHKSETFEKFKEFQSEVENQRNKKIKFLRSDRGGEYLSYEFGMHLKKCGILSQLTPPGTPQRNGVSERRNRTLLDMVRSMMSLTDLPLSFWSYALETAAFTLNRAPSKSVETTPYELWFNKKPKLSFLKVWGCEAYVKKLQPDKLEPKAEKCVFIGYPKETIGYTFYHRSEGKIFVAKNGTFLEKEFLTKEVTGRKVELDEIEESLLVDQSSAVPENVPVPPTPATEEANDNDHETSNETATEPRRSTRDRATPDWYDPCLNVMIVDNNDEDATYEEAMMSPDSNKWQEAMKSEMGSMYDNKVWTLVDLPDSRKAVENKWIFKRKTDADGNITVYKARLVAKGFRQIQGVDYDETFSPVAKLKSVRILLAIAAFFDYEIWQMDVKTAFLNGDIEEELYMVQPKGFVDPKNADKVIKDFGFIQCHGEACIYKKVSGSSVAFLILYVDDILLIGNDIELLSSVKGYLNNSFSMKDLGEASYILGIKIYRDRSRRLIGLSQSTYLDKILKKFRMDESKKGFLPMLPGKVLSKTQGPATAEERERMSQIPYASAVGSI